MSESATARRYLGLDGFRDLVRTVKDVSTIDTSQLVLVSGVGVEVKAVGKEDSRLIEFIITTDRLDRDQDTIDPEGWEFKDYENNPVVLWCHDHYQPVIANSRSLTTKGNQVHSMAEFTPPDLNPFGYMIYRLYEAKFMHAVSAGYQPIEFTLAADRKYGINYVKQALLEYSCVPVGSNPDALRKARTKGIDVTPMFDWAGKTLDEQSGMSDEARRRMEVLRSVSAPSGRALILELGDMRMAEKDEEKKEKKPAASAIKMVERYDCGTKGCTPHATTEEAEACASFDVSVTDATKSLQIVAGLVKSGRTLSAEAKALLRSVVDEVAPVAKAADEDEDEDEEEDDDEKKAKKEGEEKDDDEEDEDEDESEEEEGKKDKSSSGFALRISEEALTKAVTDAVNEEFSKATGRVVD